MAPKKCSSVTLSEGKRGGKFYRTKSGRKVYCHSKKRRSPRARALSKVVRSIRRRFKSPRRSVCDKLPMHEGKRGGKYVISKGRKVYCHSKKRRVRSSASRRRRSLQRGGLAHLSPSLLAFRMRHML